MFNKTIEKFRGHTVSFVIVFTLALICFNSYAYVASAQTVPSSMLAELQAQITALMEKISVLQGGGATPTEGNRIITIGSEVKAAAHVRVRVTAGGTILGTQQQDKVGTVVAGPVIVNGTRWYNVDFAVGLDGWVSGAWLNKSTVTTIDVQTFITTDSGESNEMTPGLDDASIAKITVSAASYDRYANKVVLKFTPAAANGEDLPWVAFEKISLWANGWNILSINAGDMSKWRKEGDSYLISAFAGNQKIAADRAYNFTITVTSDEDTPAGDRWNVTVPAKGVVIWSQANGHMTNVASLTTYPIVFLTSEEEEDREVLSVEIEDASGNAAGENGERGEFRLEFSVYAEDSDIYIKKNSSASSKDSGAVFTTDGPGATGIISAVTSDAAEDGGYYVISEGESESFEINVSLESTIAGNYRVTLDALNYLTTLNGAVSNYSLIPKEDFRTPYVVLTGGGTQPTAKISSFTTATPNPVLGAPVVLSWVSTGTSVCTLLDIVDGTQNTVQTNLPIKGTTKVFPYEKYERGIVVPYLLRCQSASTQNDVVVEAKVIVTLAQATVTPPTVKPTPRFNGLTYPVGTGNTAVSAVFSSVKTAVTGPVLLGKINWGEVGIDSQSVSALPTGTQTTVELKHVYKKAGVYVITLTNASDGKTVSQKVTVTLPVVAPVVATCTLVATPAAIITGQSVVLSWITKNATTVAVNQNIGVVDMVGKKTITPTKTTTYELTAVAANGVPALCTKSVIVKPLVISGTVTSSTTASSTGLVRGAAVVNQLALIQVTLTNIQSILSELK